MKIIHSANIYDNPLPQLRSRQSAFPFIAECNDGTLVALHVIGEAFESVNSTTYASYSNDGGKTWSEPVSIFDSSEYNYPVSDCAKPTRLPDGSLIAFGYAYDRRNPDYPLGNPETGGLLDDFIFYVTSTDNGKTWSKPTAVDCSWGPHVEASAPITVLQSGAWVSPITGFPKWDGTMTGPMCGRLMRSDDNGKTWNDDAVCMQFDEPVTCYEQRVCELASGTLINIGWNENTQTGERMYNHYTASFDGGRTWTAPESTGVMGQASSVCAIGGEKLLALHAVRRDTDRPGIYAYIVDFSEHMWNVVESTVVWEPAMPMIKDAKMAEIFSFLKFGQPGAILLSDGDVMMSHWCAEEGRYRTVATRIKL